MSGSTPICNTLTTIVAVDDSLQRSIPLPCADALRSAITDDQLPKLEPLEGSRRPANAFCWQTVARWAECDQLGHVNQSQYCLLMEEARAVASAAGGYGACIDGSVASAPPSKFQLNY